MTSTSDIFEQPWAKPKREDCKFYHSVDLLSGETINGDWDLRGKLAEYTGHVDVNGCRVLDMGAASGALSFYMESLGAKVVSADVRSASQYTKVPYFDDPYTANPHEWLQMAESRLWRMKNSFWYQWHELGSKNQVYYGDLINITKDIGLFEVGFIGQIMVHNRDPLGILQSVAQRTTSTVIISEGMDTQNNRQIAFLPNVSKGIRPHGWFRFSVGALTEFLELMGFKVRSVKTEAYDCLVRDISSSITTIVADRLPNTMVGNRKKAVIART